MKEPSLLAVDPGLRTAGAAIFKGPCLAGCALIQAGDDLRGVSGIEVWGRMGERMRRWESGVLGGGYPEHIAIEKMTIVTRGSGGWSGIPPESLLQVTGSAGAVAHACSGPNTRVWRDELPSRWKGSINKEVMWRRVQRQLTEKEQEIVAFAARLHAPNLRHNIYDAVMLGMYCVGRTAKGGRAR